MPYNEYWWIMFLVSEDGKQKPKIWRLPANIQTQLQADQYGREKLRNNPFVAYSTHNADQSDAVTVGRAKLIDAGYDISGSLSRTQHNFNPEDL